MKRRKFSNPDEELKNFCSGKWGGNFIIKKELNRYRHGWIHNHIGCSIQVNFTK
jgi:hypothetical protein